MGLFLQHKTKDIHWAIWKMEESLESLLTLLPATRRIFCEQEMQRFTSERRKMEWLSVRVLLYSMLQEDKEIIYSSEGNLLWVIILFYQYFSYQRLCGCDTKSDCSCGYRYRTIWSSCKKSV